MEHTGYKRALQTLNVRRTVPTYKRQRLQTMLEEGRVQVLIDLIREIKGLRQRPEFWQTYYTAGPVPQTVNTQMTDAQRQTGIDGNEGTRRDC